MTNYVTYRFHLLDSEVLQKTNFLLFWWVQPCFSTHVQSIPVLPSKDQLLLPIKNIGTSSFIGVSQAFHMGTGPQEVRHSLGAELEDRTGDLPHRPQHALQGTHLPSDIGCDRVDPVMATRRASDMFVDGPGSLCELDLEMFRGQKEDIDSTNQSSTAVINDDQRKPWGCWTIVIMFDAFEPS